MADVTVDEKAFEHAWDTLMLCDRVGKTALRQTIEAYLVARTPAGDNALLELLESARGTLAPVTDQDWHGKWRIQRALELVEKAIAHVRAPLPASPMTGEREARLESALIDAGQILNDIRARDGTYGSFAPDYFNEVVENISELLGGDILRAMWRKMAAQGDLTPKQGKE